MRRYIHWLLPVSMALITGCSSSGEVFRYPGPQAVEEVPEAGIDASAPGAGQERQVAEQDARAEAERLAREEAARLAEQARREELARQQAEERRLEQARREQAAREQAAREQAAREQAARELAEKQQRAAQLSERIASNEASAQTLDEANEALREAVVAAENLVQVLSAEQNKYSSTDPLTGATSEPLDKNSIDSLQRELDRLKAQADMLMGQVSQ